MRDLYDAWIKLGLSLKNISNDKRILKMKIKC
jgi:hypothetical protein